jgi:hypothetical protein
MLRKDKRICKFLSEKRTAWIGQMSGTELHSSQSITYIIVGILFVMGNGGISAGPNRTEVYSQDSCTHEEDSITRMSPCQFSTMEVGWQHYCTITPSRFFVADDGAEARLQPPPG